MFELVARHRDRLQWGAVLFVVWLGLTDSLAIQELLAGLLVVGTITWLTIPPPRDGEPKPWQVLGMVIYLPVFLKNLVVANLDVAARVLNPRLPIKPGIVKIQTDLTEPYQRLILANSITLTPGTVTLETEGSAMYVHWIDVRSTDPVEAGRLIKGDMEARIRRV